MHQALSALADLAEALDRAASARSSIPQLSLGLPLSVADAYEVQRRLVERRVQRGERLVGVKLGFTSRAKMQQMGVSDLIWGRLTSGMQVAPGGRIAVHEFIHPRVEPEVAFLLRHRLAGRVSSEQAMAAVAGVAPALEVIDSRYADFKFNLADVVADNCSSAAFVIGAWQAPPRELAGLDVVLEIDGRAAQRGSTSAILGSPALALAEASRLAADAGFALEPGWVVMAGAATAAEPLAGSRQARVSIEQLGAVSLHLAPDEVAA